jgi:hypothetical protein
MYGKGGDGMTGIHVAQVMTGIQQNAREKIIPNISPCMPLNISPTTRGNCEKVRSATHLS